MTDRYNLNDKCGARLDSVFKYKGDGFWSITKVINNKTVEIDYMIGFSDEPHDMIVLSIRVNGKLKYSEF